MATNFLVAVSVFSFWARSLTSLCLKRILLAGVSLMPSMALAWMNSSEKKAVSGSAMQEKSPRFAI